MKRCPRCKMLKIETEFNRHAGTKDGLQSRCRSCQVEANRESRVRHLEVYREQKRRQYQRELSSTGYRVNKHSHPYKQRAHRIVYNAVHQGVITKPSSCPLCGSSVSPIQAHHHDYSKPLDVQWLCAPCHGRLHAGAST